MAPYDHVKLAELAKQQGIASQPPLTRLRPLTSANIPNFVTPASEQQAGQCLQQGKSSKLSRTSTVFRTKNSLEKQEAKNIAAVLPGLVDANASAGVIQALLNQEFQLLSAKDGRRGQSPSDGRDDLLLKAVDKSNVELVCLFALQASEAGRNQALAIALSNRASNIIRKLLEYGANPTSCSQQFRDAAASGDDFIVERLLEAPIVPQGTILEALVPAVQSGSLRTLQLIVDVADLRVLSEIPAIKVAVDLGQVHALLTLLLAAKSIRPAFLDPLVLQAFEDSSIDAASLQTILHALLHAGASGSRCSAAMRLAVEQQQMTFISLFVEHKVDINWGNGRVVRSAVETGNYKLLHEVLRSGSLSSENASVAVKSLRSGTSPNDRYNMMEALLRAGAYGEPVEAELVDAVENENRDLVVLLRNNRVSVDTKHGDALVAAIMKENIELLGILLNGSVEKSSLRYALPCVRGIREALRLPMTRLLVEAKVDGDEVDVALKYAVCDESRDQDLIDVLLRAGGSPMYDNAQCLRFAIADEDFALFEKLLKSPAGCSPGTMSSLIPDIITIRESNARLNIMRSALTIPPKESSVSSALLKTVLEDKPDIPLLKLLVRSGQADINHCDGVILKNGICADLSVLTELLRLPDRSRGTTSTALVELLQQRNLDDQTKATRAGLLLNTRRTSKAATEGVLRYIDFLKGLEVKGEHWPLQTFEVLFKAGAEIERLTEKGALLDVTKAAASRLLKIMLALKPEVLALDEILLEAVRLRCTNAPDIVWIILKAGSSTNGIASALIEASHTNLTETCSILLKNGASMDFDNFAAIRHAAASGNTDLLHGFLESKPSREAVEAAFNSAMTISDGHQRYQVMQAILKLDISPELVSKCLIEQVNICAQKEMITLLLNHKAEVHFDGNRCLVLAALRGNFEIVQLLFANATNTPAAATQCFDECIKNNQIQQNRISVLNYLLEMGAQGHSLSIASQQVVRKLPTQPGLLHLLEMLVVHGADVNYENGQALCDACKTTGLEAVTTLVQGNPSVMVRSRAMHFLLESNVSPLEFCQIFDVIMQTGSETPDLSSAQIGFEQPPKNALKTLLTRRPSGEVEIEHILSYHTELLSQPINEDILSWAIIQRNPGVCDKCLGLLISRGANVKYQDARTGDSILLQAIKCGRSKLVKSLLSHGAGSSIADVNGKSPLLLASERGDHLAVTNLLEMGALADDGSLHFAARELQAQVVELLLKNGHDPDYRSPLCDGRTPLAELLYAAKANSQNHNVVKEVMRLLERGGADIRTPVSRKPLICWALDNKCNPVQMVEAVIGACRLYKELDAEYNFYRIGHFVYSPTMYVAMRQFEGPQECADELISLLKNRGANKDVYYCDRGGPQPKDAQGMPEYIAIPEMTRRARLAMWEEEEKHLDRRRYIEDEERRRRRQIEDEEDERRQQKEERDFQRELEYGRRREAEKLRLMRETSAVNIANIEGAEAATQRGMRSRNDLQRMLSESQAASRRQIQQQERQDELSHQTAMNELAVGKTRQMMLLESDHQKETAAIAQSASEAQRKEQKQLLSTQDYYDAEMHKRKMNLIAYEKAVPVSLSPRGGGYIEN